jgi:hypothetical protein
MIRAGAGRFDRRPAFVGPMTTRSGTATTGAGPRRRHHAVDLPHCRTNLLTCRCLHHTLQEEASLLQTGNLPEGRSTASPPGARVPWNPVGGRVVRARDPHAGATNVSPFDPVTIAGVSLLVVAVGLLACFWPARRASRFDPIALLRQN